MTTAQFICLGFAILTYLLKVAGMIILVHVGAKAKYLPKHKIFLLILMSVIAIEFGRIAGMIGAFYE